MPQAIASPAQRGNPWEEPMGRFMRANVRVTGAQGQVRPKGADSLGRPCRLAGYVASYPRATPTRAVTKKAPASDTQPMLRLVRRLE